MDVQRAIDKFISDRAATCAASTLQLYQKHLRLLKTFLAGRGVHQIGKLSPRLLLSYVAATRSRNLSPVTIRKRILFLRSFGRWLKQKRLVRRDPAQSLSVPKSGKRQPKALAPDEIRKLLNTSRWEPDGNVERDYALLLLFLDSGIRLGEMAALEANDIDFARCFVHIRHGKGDKERWSVFTEETRRALRKGFPFVDGRGRKLSALSIYRVVKRRAAQVGVNASPHRLRHTFLTEYLNAGGNPYWAKELAGHDDIRTTLSYASVAVGPMQREHWRFTPLRAIRRR